MSRRDDSANALLKLVLDRDEVPHDANVGGGVIDSHVADPLFRLTMPERAFRRRFWSRPGSHLGCAFLLADPSVRGDHQGVAWFVSISRCGGVLDQPDIVREDIARHSSRGIFIARIPVIDSEGNAGRNWYIVERDFVPVRRN